MKPAGHIAAYPVEPITERPFGQGMAPPERRIPSPTQPFGTLERAFACSGLTAAVATAGGAWLAEHGYGWSPLLAVASSALLTCAIAGLWAQHQVVRHQRGELALVYATAVQGPRRNQFDRRNRDQTRMESLAMSFADLVDSVRMTVSGRDHVTRWVVDMRRTLAGRSQTSENLAALLGEDAHAIAAAANASRRAEVEIVSGIEDMLDTANRAAAATTDMTHETLSLTDAVRQVTAQIKEAAGLAATLADNAMAAQRGIATMQDVTASLGQAADQVKAVLQRAEMLGINAGIEAARAGESGRGFAVVAAEVKNLATNGQTALDAMLGIVRSLRSESTGMHATIDVMSEAVHAQTQLGQILGDAASNQILSIGRVVAMIEAANIEVVSLRDRAREMGERDLTLGTGVAARKAVERLPAHAAAVAAILRDLPVFEPAREKELKLH